MDYINEQIFRFLCDKYGEGFVQYDEKEGAIFVQDEDRNVGYMVKIEMTT